MRGFTFDTETNGLRSKIDNAISIGGTFWDNRDKYVVGNGDFERFLNWKLIKKNFSIPEDTIKVHGITMDILEEKGENPVNVYVDLYHHLINFDLDIINGFNLSFDLNMIYGDLDELIRLGLDTPDRKLQKLLDFLTKDKSIEANGKPLLFIDSLMIDRIFRATVDGLKVRHSLDDATRHYDIINEGAHDALFDTHATVQLVYKQIDDLESRGIEFDDILEGRLIRKYIRSQEYYKKLRGKEYDPYYRQKIA